MAHHPRRDPRRTGEVLPEAEATFRLLFAHNPLPMWVYDLETLEFLEVNDAAVASYGYSREEFLRMRIADVRPEEDVEALLEDVQQPRPALQQRARWRHRRKDGALLDVEVSSHTLRFKDRDAALVVARDVTDVRLAEQDRALLAAIVESSADAIISKTLGGVITSWNPAAERIFGYTAQETLGQSVLALIPPDRQDEEARILARIERGERIDHLETVRVAKDGRRLDVALSVSPIRDRAGQVVGAAKILRDVTERRRTEAALREQEARYRSIVENAPVVLFALDAAGTITLFEGRGLDRLGRVPGEIVGQSAFELYAGQTEIVEALRKGLAGEAASWTIQRKEAHFDVHSAPFFDEDGRVSGLIGVGTDVTERHEARSRLELLYRTTDTLLSGIVDFPESLRQLTEALVPALADWGALHLVNDDGAVERVVFLHAGEGAVAAMPEAEAPVLLAPRTATSRVLRTGMAELHPEIPDAMIVELARDERHLEHLRGLGLTSALMVPLAARGRTLGVLTLATTTSGRRYGPEDLAMAEDLAKRAALAIDNARLFEATQRANAELEQRVRERTAQLEAANQELESFSYSVSHDLRSPLRAIEGFTRILVEQHAANLDPKAQDYLQRVRRNALRMGTLIDDLLQFSRIGRKEIQRQTVRPAELVRQVLEELAPEDQEVRIDVGDLPACSADPMMLKQVYVNLLGNAFKFSQYRNPAEVRVGAERRDGQVVYFVADNGAGFDMRYADQLFGVFQRLHRAEEYEGTGVGLAIVQRIVHRLGGEVWAESAPGEGATFFFTLPAHPPPPKP